MLKIYYRFSDGHGEFIEVEDEFAKIYAEIEKESNRNDWKFDYRNRKLQDSIDALPEWKTPMDTTMDLERTYIEREFEETFLPLLTEKQRQIYRLYYVQGYETREISKLLGISQPTVMSHIKGIQKKYLRKF